jgi:hypothetical protein
MSGVSRQLEHEAMPKWREAMAQYERDAEAAKECDKAWRENVRAAASNSFTLPDRPRNAEAPDKPPSYGRIAEDTR